jgi:hypothetical protein
MALFPQVNFTAGGLEDRTHTNLVKSEGMSPAEKWILDPDLPGLFEYRFGGFGYVVIPKGKVVAVTAPKYDWETEKVVNCLTIANGTNTPVGVAPYNFYQKNRDRMGDNQLSIINREYIEVPFITGSDATDMKWGCATGANATALSAGDFVKPDASGNFVKWATNKAITETFADVGDADAEVSIYLKEPIKAGSTVVVENSADGTAFVAVAEFGTVRYAAGTIVIASGKLADGDHVRVTYTSAQSDPIEQMVGQILAVETDLPPLGWLAYFLNMESMQNELNDAIIGQSWAPATAGGYPGTTKWADLVKAKFSPGTGDVSGIKFLTDGYFRAKTTYGTTTTPVAVATATTGTAVAGAGITVSNSTLTLDYAGAGVNEAQVRFKLAYPIAADDEFHVYFNGTEVNEGSKFHVDYYTNQLTLYPATADTDADGKIAVTIACTLIKDQVPGIPTEWDYKGSVGAVRILLCK